MECETIQPFLPAYGDNELSVEGALEVERHLQVCAQCRALLEERRRFTEAVRTLYPRAPLPPGLEARVRRILVPPPARRYWVSALALAASVAVMLATWSFVRRGHPVLPAAVVAAAQVHRGVLAHEIPLAVQSSDAAAVNAWLRRELPFAVGAPVQATTADLTLQGAARVTLAGEQVGYVQYGTGAQVVSLLLLPPREWPRVGEPVRVRGMDFHFYVVDGLKLIAWNHSPLSYVLVSDLGGQGARACTVCHGGAGDAALRGFADQGLI